MKDPLDRLFEGAQLTLQQNLESITHPDVTKCESPIEVLFLKSLCLFHLVTRGRWLKINDQPGDDWVRVQTQVTIGDYRVDFLVTDASVQQSLIIECDGHDFHERTKEQAARDRSRDRTLTAMGYRVIRFTGSELWRDPWKCAEDVEAQLMNAFHLETKE